MLGVKQERLNKEGYIRIVCYQWYILPKSGLMAYQWVNLGKYGFECGSPLTNMKCFGNKREVYGVVEM